MSLTDSFEFFEKASRNLSHPLAGIVVVWRHFIHYLRLAAYGRRLRRKGAKRYLGVVPRRPLPFYTLWGVSQSRLLQDRRC